MSPSIELSSAEFAREAVDVLAFLVTEGDLAKQKVLAPLGADLLKELSALAEEADFRGRPDQVLEAPTLGRLPAKRIALVGVGAARSVRSARLRAGAAIAARVASSRSSVGVVPPAPPKAPELRALAEGIALGSYRFTKYLTGDRAPKRALSRAVIFKGRGKASASEQRAVELGARVGAAVNLARDAVNEPPNVMTPEGLAAFARQVARDGKLKVTVLDEKGIRRAKMNLHAAVGQGSANPPRLIHLTYTPRGAKKTIAFVGKGLSFDSGGLSIKPAAGMEEMKDDMAGGAAVIALMAAVAAVSPRVAVHAIVGAAENMPDGGAYRPADVITSLDGKTVEIINTDAEGRLVLADALAYARNLEPDLIIDVATLTGACLVALGKTCSAFYTADARIARDFERAASEAGETFWRMPLLEELREQLKSEIADLKHTGDRYGGSITAALFLREFVGSVPWVHCDIAGPVLGDRPRGVYPKGATGHPVLTFLEFVERFG